MPPNIFTSHHGTTLTVRLTGALDRRIASALFSRFLSAQSGYKDLIVDVSGVDQVHDTGLVALRLLRSRARDAGKRLTVIDSHTSDRPASAPVPHERTAAPLPQLASDRPWASALHAHGLGLPRAWSRIATPARRGGLTCGALFARAPMAGQARAVREATDAQ